MYCYCFLKYTPFLARPLIAHYDINAGLLPWIMGKKSRVKTFLNTHFCPLQPKPLTGTNNKMLEHYKTIGIHLIRSAPCKRLGLTRHLAMKKKHFVLSLLRGWRRKIVKHLQLLQTHAHNLQFQPTAGNIIRGMWKKKWLCLVWVINALTSTSDSIESSLGIQLVRLHSIKGVHRQLGQSY